MKLGLHVSDFGWPGSPGNLGPTLIEVAQSAEAAGFVRLTVMDHLWQIDMIGPPEEPMLEAYAAIGYVAAATRELTLHSLVTAATYREPGLLAKTVATLGSLSGGRVMLGIGAGWFDDEARGLGLAFPALAERFERLDETLQICHQMWSGSEEPFNGKHYRLERTLCAPRPAERPRILIGGSGEKKTLRLVAKYADACNIYFGYDVPTKLNALREHCEREGRSYDAIEKTSTMAFDLGENGSGVKDLLERLRSLADQEITFVYGHMAAADYVSQMDRFAQDVVPVIADW
jgi:F420-dependent oxidoreductase-like protein